MASSAAVTTPGSLKVAVTWAAARPHSNPTNAAMIQLRPK
jgi:hypothetical protein